MTFYIPRKYQDYCCTLGTSGVKEGHWEEHAWRRCRRRSRWGSWRRRWRRAPGGWSWWSKGSKLGDSAPPPPPCACLHCTENVFVTLICTQKTCWFFFVCFITGWLFDTEFERIQSYFGNILPSTFFFKSQTCCQKFVQPWKSCTTS